MSDSCHKIDYAKDREGERERRDHNDTKIKIQYTILLEYSSDAWCTALSQEDNSAVLGDICQYLRGSPKLKLLTT